MERLRRNAGFNHSISTPDHAHQVASLETSMIDNSQPIEREHGKQSSSDNARRSAYSDPLSPRRRALSTQTVAKMILPDKESPSSPLSSCPDSPPSSPLNSAAVSAPLPRSTRKALHLDTSSSEVSAASRSRRAVAAGSKNVESKASLTSAVLSYADAKTKLKAKAPPSATTTSKPTVSAASEERWGPGQRRLAADSPFAPDAIDATLTLTRPKKFTRGLVLPKSSSSDGFVAQKSNGPSRGDNGPQLSAKEKQMLCVAQKGKPQEQSRPLQRKEYAETVKFLRECPFCNEEMPRRPTQQLCDIMQPWLDRYHKNPRGIKATDTLVVCTKHREESEVIPSGQARGWPVTFETDRLTERLSDPNTDFKQRMEEVISDPQTSHFMQTAQSYRESSNASAASSLAAQMAQAQVGYYGEKGWELFRSVLTRWFLSGESEGAAKRLRSSEDLERIQPFGAFEFIDLVLIPELTCLLIIDDDGQRRGRRARKISFEEALQIKAASTPYGIAMFPADVSTTSIRNSASQGLSASQDHRSQQQRDGTLGSMSRQGASASSTGPLPQPSQVRPKSRPTKLSARVTRESSPPPAERTSLSGMPKPSPSQTRPRARPSAAASSTATARGSPRAGRPATADDSDDDEFFSSVATIRAPQLSMSASTTGATLSPKKRKLAMEVANGSGVVADPIVLSSSPEERLVRPMSSRTLERGGKKTSSFSLSSEPQVVSQCGSGGGAGDDAVESSQQSLRSGPVSALQSQEMVSMCPSSSPSASNLSLCTPELPDREETPLPGPSSSPTTSIVPTPVTSSTSILYSLQIKPSSSSGSNSSSSNLLPQSSTKKIEKEAEKEGWQVGEELRRGFAQNLQALDDGDASVSE